MLKCTESVEEQRSDFADDTEIDRLVGTPVIRSFGEHGIRIEVVDDSFLVAG